MRYCKIRCTAILCQVLNEFFYTPNRQQANVNAGNALALGSCALGQGVLTLNQRNVSLAANLSGGLFPLQICHSWKPVVKHSAQADPGPVLKHAGYKHGSIYRWKERKFNLV